MPIGQWRDYFFLNFACEDGKITRLWLVLRLSNNSLCFREVAKKNYVPMASRFEIVDEEYIKELKDKSENENTKKSTEYWKNLFKKSANEKKLPSKFRRVQKRCSRPNTIAVLCQVMTDFTRSHSITYTKRVYTWSYLFLNYRIVIHNLRRTDAHEKAKFWLLLTFECASFELVR